MITQDKFVQMIDASRGDTNALEKYHKLAKLNEEVDELSTTMLVFDGIIKEKDGMEPVMGEIADCILMIIDIAQICYPSLPSADVYTLLQHQINKKYLKWEAMMNVDPNIVVEAAQFRTDFHGSATPLTKSWGTRMMNAQQLYEHRHTDRGLSDEDIAYAVQHFYHLSESLQPCGPVFELAYREANDTYYKFLAYAGKRRPSTTASATE